MLLGRTILMEKVLKLGPDSELYNASGKLVSVTSVFFNIH